MVSISGLGAAGRNRVRSTAASAVLLVLGVGSMAVCAQAQTMPNLGGAFKPQVLPAKPASSALAAPASPSAASNAPAAAAQSDTSGLRIVLIGGTRKFASIDGRVVQVGDRINGMRVTRIGPSSVVLAGEGGVREELQVHPAAQKLPANSTRVSHGARP